MKQERIKGKKVLVTGGAGFIGSNLCADLLEHDNQVVCLDNFSTCRRTNIQPLLQHARFTLIEGDIRDRATCARACEGIDVLLHEAALGSVPRSLDDPATTHDVNVTGFLNMLIAARDAEVGRIIYATSSSVYGDSPMLPKVEHVTGRPLSPYAVTKCADELYARVFALSYGMNIIGLRYFNVFGRNQDPDGAYAAAIPRFIKQLIRYESPVIHGDGSQSRDFTYIENIILLNHLAATTTNKEALGEVFNGAAGRRTDLNTLLSLLKQNLGKFDARINEVKPAYEQKRPGDIEHSHASIEKAHRLLGYDPEWQVDRGLAESVKWYWENLRS